MKQILATLACLCSIAAIAQDPFITNGLALYYPFSIDARDASGHGLNGTVAGATKTVDRFGSAGSAYSFSGAQGHITFPETVFGPAVQEFTFSAWVAPRSDHNGGQGLIIEKGGVNGEAQLMVTGGNYQFDANITGAGFVLVKTPIKLNTYAHVVGAYKRGQYLKLWVDGELKGTTASTTNRDLASSNPGSMSAIGIYRGTTTNFAFNGNIDDVRIYTRALADAEVKVLFELERKILIPRRPVVVPDVVNGFLVGVRVLDGGNGYVEAPPIRIVGGGGTNAVAEAVIINGVLAEVKIKSAGTGYATAPQVIVSPPRSNPSLDIQASRVRVTMGVTFGKRYQLESSGDLKAWSAIGGAFIAPDDEIVQEFDVDDSGRYFRLFQVP